MIPADIHIPALPPLVDADDWTALARYWIIHEHVAALDAAIGAARRLAKRDRRWGKLPSFLETFRADPSDPRIAPPEALRSIDDSRGQLALTVLQLYPRASLCNDAVSAPAELREKLYLLGVEAAQQTADVVLADGDQAFGAHFIGLVAKGLHALGELESAAQEWEASAEIYRELADQEPDRYLLQLASTLHHLANARRGQSHLDAARDIFLEELEVRYALLRRQPDVDRSGVALTLDCLGSVQSSLKEFESACRNYEDALRIHRELANQWPDVFRPSLALTLHNLGSVQRELNQLDAARNSLREAQEVLTDLAGELPDYRTFLASTLHILGLVESDLNDWPSARGHYQDALDIYRDVAEQQPEAYRSDIAMTFDSLGNAQTALNDQEGALDNFTRAVELLRELTKERPEEHQADLASALNNLGNVQGYLNELEAARNSHEEALAIRRELATQQPKLYERDVASSSRNLGIDYYDLNDMEAALSLFAKALELFRELATQSPEPYRAELAVSLNNIGCTEHALKRLDAARESLGEALRLFRDLARKRPDEYRHDLAMALDNLGSVQADLNDLGAARHSYAESLEIYEELSKQRPDVHRSEVGRVLNNLGSIQQDLNELEAARASFERAAQLLESDPLSQLGARLSERARVWTNLGTLYRTKGPDGPDYGAARAAFRKAVDFAEDLRGHLRDRSLRSATQAVMLDPYELLVHTCVDLWETEQDLSALEEAVHIAERGRSRSLMERLSEEDLAPRNVSEEEFAEFLRLRRELDAAKFALETERLDLDPNRINFRRNQMVSGRPTLLATSASVRDRDGRRRSLRAAQSLGGFAFSAEEDEVVESPAPGATTALVAEAEARLSGLQAELRLADPEWDPDRPVIPLSCTEIQALIPTDSPTAFVQFTIAADTGLAVVVTRDNVECVKLPGLLDSAGSEAAWEWIKSNYNLSQPAHEWDEDMDERLSVISEALLPLWFALERSATRRVVFSPNRWLHVFPLHACLLADRRQRAADVFEISYTPSFSVLGRCAGRDRALIGPALIVGNPTGDLVFTEAELAAAKCHYTGAHVLDGSFATKPKILTDAPLCWLFLYTGHATFDADKPMRSSLILETKDRTQRAKWLSLGEAFCQLNLGRCSLAILNGCESGMLMPDHTDEYLALSSGFLHAGAVCVLGSLWAVHDFSAALLMNRFHAEWRSGKCVAAALREAARWLREEIRNGAELLDRVLPEFLRGIPRGTTLYDACVARAQEYAARAGSRPPFASPVHWAAFTAVGKAW